MILYKSIMKMAIAERTIEKSRFVAYASPIESREEALDFIRDCKIKNKGATHFVPAFITGISQDLQWCSDDGEPQGSSGQPVLKMMAGEGITNIIVVVVRYFGGIKLGTGGLARAYSSVAKEAINLGLICNVEKAKNFEIQSDYKDFQKIVQSAEKGNFIIENQRFNENIEANLVIKWENAEKAIKDLMDLTNGRMKIFSERDKLLKNAIDNKNTVC
ncbi:MAG: YigZ family protein [Eubacteriales bacterium]